MQKKMQKLAKQLDYIERARREEEKPLLENKFTELREQEKSILC